MKNDEVWAELQKLPSFFKAIGRGEEPIAFTAYGGDKGNYHFKKNTDNTAREVEVNEETLRKLAKHGERARAERNHQLGFYPGRGGSKLRQLTTIPCLKAESDKCTRDNQMQVYKEFEHMYGIKLTIVDTGNKSMHAYLNIIDGIESSSYTKTCRAFNERLRETGDFMELGFIADTSIFGPAQAMRLPGAIHKITGNVAKVISYGEPCTLQDIEIDEEYINEVQQASHRRQAIEMLCLNDQLFGYEGDEAYHILKSMAEAWPKRVPGDNTYNLVVPLIGGLTNLLGANQASTLLYEAGHFDQAGNHSQDGLLNWCNSFSPRGESNSAIKARLAERAERQFGWKRPEISHNSLILKSTELTASQEDIRQKVQDGGGVLTHRTGSGKTICTVATVRNLVDQAQIEAFGRGGKSKASCCILTPRTALNEQNSRLAYGINVSQPKKRGDRFVLENIYVCCAMKLGDPKALNGNKDLWNEFYTYSAGKNTKSEINTGAGMPAAAFLVIDEFRQTMEMLLISTTKRTPSGNGLWATPKEHMDTLRNTIITMENAARVYCLDAQMGTVDQELLLSIRPGRNDSMRVIGHMPEKNGGAYAWTSDTKSWRQALFNELLNPDRKKPIICIVAEKGNASKPSMSRLSAWSLKKQVESITPESAGKLLQAEVIDADTKENLISQAILNAGKIDCDLVIATSVAQSGYSWVDTFHDVGFVVGGESLPPNIAGGQAGRRERTLKRCIAYLPDNVISSQLPYAGMSREEIKDQLTEAHYEHDQRIDKYAKIVIEAQANYAHRRINELCLFKEFSLAYAKADGWDLEELGKDHQRIELKKAEKTKRTSSQIKEWRELSAGQQYILMALSGEISIEDLSEKQRKYVMGGVGLDLVGINLVALANLLKRAKFDEICDGNIRDREDMLITHCAQVLSEHEAIKVLNLSDELSIRVGRASKSNNTSPVKGNKGLKLIGTVVKGLGGMNKITYGKNGVKALWLLPTQNEE